MPFRKERELYRSFFSMLGFYPHNISYYKLALTHKSIAAKDENGKLANNERLEFLGDAILDAVVGDIVFRHFRKKNEGFLTNARSKIVQRETLGKIAIEIGLDKLVQYSCKKHGHNSHIEGNAFEAIVGAIYLDRGYVYCMQFMEKRIIAHLLNIDKIAFSEANFKSKLFEWCQKNRLKLEINLLNQHEERRPVPVFKTQVVIEDIKLAIGLGYSKKESQQVACRETLKQLKKDKKLESDIFLNKEKRTAMEANPAMAVPSIEPELELK